MAERFFVKAGEDTFWLDTANSLVAKAVTHTDKVTRFVFAAEVYWHRYPVVPGMLSCCFWCVPWWATVVYGPDYGRGARGNFCGKNAPIWRCLMRDVMENFDATPHLRASVKSRVAAARACGSQVDAAMLMSGEQEFSLSTFGMVMLTGAIAVNGKMSQYHGEAAKFLQIITEMCCGDSALTLELADGVTVQILKGDWLKVGFRWYVGKFDFARWPLLVPPL